MAESAPVRFVKMLYRHGMRQGGHSWTKFNTALYEALCLAIESRMKFARTDFGTIYNACAGSYWFGSDHDGQYMGERFYTVACMGGNLSACLAFEHWRGRGPYWWMGKRLYVGGDIYGRGCGFPWDGYEHVLVSTIRSDVLIATVSEYAESWTDCPKCHRRVRKGVVLCERCGQWESEPSVSAKPKRIWKIPRDTFQAIERLRKKVIKEDTWWRDWERVTRWLATVDPAKPLRPVRADAVEDLQTLASLMRPKAKLEFVEQEAESDG